MGLLDKTGIDNGSVILAGHVVSLYNALTIGTHDVVATGSFTGSFAGSFTGSFAVESASFATSASRAATASYVNGNIFVAGNLATSSSFAISASRAVTASHAITASYIAANSLTQNITITGSLNVSGSVSQTSSSIIVTLPSGSSTQKYGVAIFKYKQFSYNISQTKVYEDDYIRLGYDAGGYDPELRVKIDPAVGRVQCVSFSTKFPSNTEAIDGITSLAAVDIWPDFGLGSDEVLTTYITAGVDPTYPYYIVNWYRTNTLYGGNISCVVHRYGTDI